MTASRPPISPTAQTQGLVYFPRMLDKIRLDEAGVLPAAYQANLGGGMDSWTCSFLKVDYRELRDRVVAGATDDEALAWCRERGRVLDDFEIWMFNQFLAKRGFRDDLTDRLAQRKEESGFSGREDIQTFFDYIDADEGRR